MSESLKTLKVISRLMCYPRVDMLGALDEMATALEEERLLPADLRRRIGALIAEFRITDVYVLQEDYVNLFDRGRAVSLHLFEHVHGESRDRGQAMVDLVDLYRRHGFELSARELPDYLPLFLEFVAEQSIAEARELLADAAPVVALIGERLALRGSRYAVLFDALQAFAGAPENLVEIREQAAAEGPDQTVVNMDKYWEEEAVTFLAPGGCGSGQATEQPIHWVKPERAGTVPAKPSVFGG
jgi:nitrate reductase molybdenum cofactor assembly chaperone NarJ/NarW